MDQVDLVYSEFITTTAQVPKMQTVLPISNEEEESSISDYIYEPSDYEVLIELTLNMLDLKFISLFLRLLQVNILQEWLRCKMLLIMLVSDRKLTLDLNKARQETITAELLDLIGGIAALEGK